MVKVVVSEDQNCICEELELNKVNQRCLKETSILQMMATVSEVIGFKLEDVLMFDWELVLQEIKVLLFLLCAPLLLVLKALGVKEVGQLSVNAGPVGFLKLVQFAIVWVGC